MIFWFEKHSKLSWIITILIAVFIFFISSLSFKTAPVGGYGWRTTVYHFYVFFFLSVFLLISIIKGKTKKKNLVFLVIILAIVYGITDEIHQIFVPGRTFAIYDILINCAGILFATYLYSLILLGKRIKNKNNKI